MPPAKKLEVKIREGAIVFSGGRACRAGTLLRLPFPAAWSLICRGLANTATSEADTALDVWLDSQPREVAKAFVFHRPPRKARGTVERTRPRDDVDAFQGELATSSRHMPRVPASLSSGV
jgi:hypothetical protein